MFVLLEPPQKCLDCVTMKFCPQGRLLREIHPSLCDESCARLAGLEVCAGAHGASDPQSLEAPPGAAEIGVFLFGRLGEGLACLLVF